MRKPKGHIRPHGVEYAVNGQLQRVEATRETVLAVVDPELRSEG